MSAAAHDALARHAWAEAFSLFEAADAASSLSDVDLCAYAYAAWWSARREMSIEIRERAHASLVARGALAEAAEVALLMAMDLHNLRKLAAAAAWIRRAEKHLAEIPEHRAHSSLAFHQSLKAQYQGDYDAALVHADRAVEIGERTRDKDALSLALLRKGRVLLKVARVAEGMALIDEAMVAAVGGELTPFVTGVVYCATIDACQELFDVDRAGEWTEAARRWCERKSITGFPGICRVHRAEILRLRGRWPDAVEEAVRASDELRSFGALHVLPDALYEIGEIRLRMGEAAAAEEAFRQVHELGRDPQPGLALLHFAAGRAEAARVLLATALSEIRPEERLKRARILPALVEVALACGDLATAAASAEELERSAIAFGTLGLDAAAKTARGAVLARSGDPAAAVSSLRRAIQIWKQGDAPYEAAKARVQLAEALRLQGDAEGARLEAAAARATFEKLGAVVELQRMDAAPPKPAPAKLDETQLASAAGIAAVGDVLEGKIELLRLLGGGGMGLVFEGKNRRTGRHVAVKVLRKEMCSDPAACQRLLQEALACGKIRHPNVVDVYDAGVHAASPYVVMELLHGESLGDRIDRDGALPIEETVGLVLQALAGLAAAHAAGIVHRDLKPDNLFLSKGDGGAIVVKVVDFGISKLDDRDVRLADTRTGTIVGTPYYMAPEQALGSKDVDVRADLYALGAVLHHALTGQPPFVADNYNALLVAILTAEAPAPRSLRPEISPALDAVIRKATSRNADERPQTATELADELKKAIAP